MNIYIVFLGGPLPDVLYLYAFLFAILIALFLIVSLFEWIGTIITKITHPKNSTEDLPKEDQEDNNFMESRAVEVGHASM